MLEGYSIDYVFSSPHSSVFISRGRCFHVSLAVANNSANCEGEAPVFDPRHKFCLFVSSLKKATLLKPSVPIKLLAPDNESAVLLLLKTNLVLKVSAPVPRALFLFEIGLV